MMEKIKWFLVFAGNPAMTVSFACQIVSRLLNSYCLEFYHYGLPWMAKKRNQFLGRG